MEHPRKELENSPFYDLDKNGKSIEIFMGFDDDAM